MLQLISATGQQTVDALAFLLAFALTALMDSVFHDKLPHDHGRAFAVNGELSKGTAYRSTPPSRAATKPGPVWPRCSPWFELFCGEEDAELGSSGAAGPGCAG